MQTRLIADIDTPARLEIAEAALRSCVHCGFCNATCPTYLIQGDERDGPRGRIYLIKSVLEGQEATRSTQKHLDRCLSCRNCETTCPSGVQYHRLLDIGRSVVETQVRRPFTERVLRGLLRYVVPRTRLFGLLLSLGRLSQPLLPLSLRRHLPARQGSNGDIPHRQHQRKVVLFDGCVQPVVTPNTNRAAARVLDYMGISVLSAKAAGCCGANEYHLGAVETAKGRARKNIDACWPLLERDAESLVVTASGCGAFIKEYADLLADDPAYADKARVFGQRVVDLVEVVTAVDWMAESVQPIDTKVAFQCPCSLQHAQKLDGQVETVLAALGAQMVPVSDSHLCCGAAGSYSLTEPVLSQQLGHQKIAALESANADTIVTANIGCQMHLNAMGHQPVRHWIELVDEAITASVSGSGHSISSGSAQTPLN